MAEQNIYYNIDSLEKDSTDVHIMGWAFSRRGAVTVGLKKQYEYDVVRTLRFDVQAFFADKVHIDKDCGFELTIKNVGKNVPPVTFSDGTEEVVERWKTYKYRKMLKHAGEKIAFFRKYTNLNTIKQAYDIWRERGIRGVISKVESCLKNPDPYEQWLSMRQVSAKQLSEQKKHSFAYSPLISIVTPIYNTPTYFLKEMIESVINQSYDKWELVLSDGSDNEKPQQIISRYAAKDKRIKSQRLTKNGGIAENTNAALDMAVGDYIAFLDHDDLLTPDALYEVVTAINDSTENRPDFIYSDEDKIDKTDSHFFAPNFKPDFSPHYLMSINYICHLTVISADLLAKAKRRLYSEYDGAQDYDLVLRCTEKARNIRHIAKVLYHWRSHDNSTAADPSGKSYTHEAGKRALTAHLTRLGIKGKIIDGANGKIKNLYRVEYDLLEKPLVSIIIPNYNHRDDLEKCLNSVWNKTTYPNYEIIIVENNSVDDDIFSYYDEIKAKSGVKVIVWNKPFNYSAINNMATKECNGKYLVFMNNDIEIITPDWLEQMVMFAQFKETAVVGAKLYYPDDTVQHGGIILGLGGVAGHSHKHYSRKDYGYSYRLMSIQELSAVTAALMLIRRDVFAEINGFDENYQVAFNDVDLCLRVKEAGYNIIFTPYVEAYHHESKSRGYEDTLEKQKRFQGECNRFIEHWGFARKDPYYNPNLTLDKEDFSLC